MPSRKNAAENFSATWLLTWRSPSFTEFITLDSQCVYLKLGGIITHLRKSFGNYFDSKKDAGRKFRHWYQRKNPFLFTLERLKNLVAFLDGLRFRTFSPHILPVFLPMHTRIPPIAKKLGLSLSYHSFILLWGSA